ncbi:hypothetical protein [Bacillus toyonensis]|uniref:hypothetical protein n=1 Tax=Bacillus toyonensis TaxID=155322 RepID=UPI002E218147|nr:hypothetical protein [Bacillus toyonensis]
MNLVISTKQIIDKIIEEFPYLEYKEYENIIPSSLKIVIEEDGLDIQKGVLREKCFREIYETIESVFFDVNFEKLSRRQRNRLKPYYTVMDMSGEGLKLQLVLKYGVLSSSNMDLLVAKTFSDDEDSKIFKSLAYFKYPYLDLIEFERVFADIEQRTCRILDIRQYLRKQLDEMNVITKLGKKAFRNEVNKRCIEMINEEIDTLMSEALEMAE